MFITVTCRFVGWIRKRVVEARKQLAWQALNTGVAGLAVLVTRRVLADVWKRLEGEPPPEGERVFRATLRASMTWAVATGVGVAVAKVFAARVSQRVWEDVAQEAPPISVDAAA